MKQIFIHSYTSSLPSIDATDLTKVPKGAVMLFDLKTGAALTGAPTGNFQLVCGRGANILPYVFPEIDVKSLTIQKSKYQAGSTFEATVTVPTATVAGKCYTVIVVKNGTVFNERNKWSFTAKASSNSDSSNVAKELRRQINALIQVGNDTLGVKAEGTGAAVKVVGLTEGDDYTLVPADELMGATVTVAKNGLKAINDKAYIADLVQRCVADKGVKYLGEDGAEIYPGYPEDVADGQYILYTLRFAVPRVAAKQRDEVVYQTVHIATAVSTAESTFDTIFGISGAAGASETPETH